MFHFFRNCQTIFQHSCNILQSCQLYIRILVASHTHQHLECSLINFSHSSRIVDTSLILICIFLIANDVEDLHRVLICHPCLWWSVEIFGPFLSWVICLFELCVLDSPWLNYANNFSSYFFHYLSLILACHNYYCAVCLNSEFLFLFYIFKIGLFL